MNIKEFQTIIKAKRLTGTWYTFVGEVEGKQVELKGYKTWLQVYTVEGIDHSNGMDHSVKQFNADLALPFGG